MADRHEAQFFEVVLDLDAATLAERLAERASHPDRPEHAVNNRLLGPDDAAELIETITPLRDQRPRAIWVDATGSLTSTLDALRSALRPPTP
jgi:predicted kinase